MSKATEKSAFYLSQAEVKDLATTQGMSQSEILLSLVEPASLLARPPISKFHVGAAGLGRSGAVYVGINLEFPGVPLYNTVHAEQFLVVNAIQHGETELLIIAINAVPCGHCRQFLSELHNADNLKFLFKNSPIKECTLPDLLPLRFKPQDVLGDDYTAVLMAPREKAQLQFTKSAREKIQWHSKVQCFQTAAEDALKAALHDWV